MSKSHIHLIAAARPNFMKIAPLFHALAKNSEFSTKIIHTGQHYDANMSSDFFDDLGLPAPHANLEVGSGNHGAQTAGAMLGYEKYCLTGRPNVIVVVGDVNSTVAAALVGAKLHIPVVHLEAGLRSMDRTMPEEINRLVTDSISDLLWTPSLDANDNLRQEGIPDQRIDFVGNIMIDSLELLRNKIEAENEPEKMGLTNEPYAVLTMHRPSNVDTKESLQKIVEQLVIASKRIPIIFPVHPRTTKQLEKHGLEDTVKNAPGIRLIEPLSYIPFMNLVFSSRIVITDSGGLQEETTYLGIPCLTMRPNTERPITVSEGTNRLVNSDSLVAELDSILADMKNNGSVPEFWDGHTADRCVDSLRLKLGS